MATTLPRRGKMTRPLTTPYSVGDVVVLTANDPDNSDSMTIDDDRFLAGDVGTIRRIFNADPKAGDAGWIMFDVLWLNAGRLMPVGESEIKPAGRTNPYRARAFEARTQHRLSRKGEAWLRRQLGTLNVTLDA